jgi:hypothetical protein
MTFYYQANVASNTSGAVRPKFVHDCDQCRFMGTVTSEVGHLYDAYLCGTGISGALGPDITLRSGDEPHENSSFPSAIAAHRGELGGGDSRWQAAARLLTEWQAAGEPELQLMDMGPAFYDHFVPAGTSRISETPDGESYVTATVVGLSQRVAQPDVEHYVATQHAQTHCHHEHDCCGNWYSGLPTWTYVPGTADRAIVVTQRHSQNV